MHARRQKTENPAVSVQQFYIHTKIIYFATIASLLIHRYEIKMASYYFLTLD